VSTPWLTISEAAEYVRASVPTLRREVARGALRAYRIGGRLALRFRAEDLDDWLRRGATVTEVAR
jgi:excisionase family DNA binding protein